MKQAKSKDDALSRTSKNLFDRRFSRRAIGVKFPSGHPDYRCPICGEKFMAGMTAFKIISVDPKTIDMLILYLHGSCLEKNLGTREQCAEADTRISDEKVAEIWDGLERLQKERKKNA